MDREEGGRRGRGWGEGEGEGSGEGEEGRGRGGGGREPMGRGGGVRRRGGWGGGRAGGRGERVGLVGIALRNTLLCDNTQLSYCTWAENQCWLTHNHVLEIV